jgi:hypothetical protein
MFLWCGVERTRGHETVMRAGARRKSWSSDPGLVELLREAALVKRVYYSIRIRSGSVECRVCKEKDLGAAQLICRDL